MVKTDALRNLLVAEYQELRRRLSRRLGSNDLATEALSEAYIKLSDGAMPAGIKKPDSYLYKIALNLAHDQRRQVARAPETSQIDAELLIDELADAERIAAARSEIKLLKLALAELPARRREIFIAALIEGKSYAQIAQQLKRSKRLIEHEVSLALLHCGKRLGKEVYRKRGPRSQDPT